MKFKFYLAILFFTSCFSKNFSQSTFTPEPEKFLKDFDQSLEVIILRNSARTAQDAAKALDCNVGAIVKSLLFRAGG